MAGRLLFGMHRKPMKTVRQALIEAFEEEMERDERVFIIGEEVGASGGPNGTTAGLQRRFGGHRVVDAPISEIGFTGLAVGASYAGLRPVVDFMTWNFALQAMDHIVNSCAKTSFMSGGRLRCPVVFRGPSGFNPGHAAQHTQEFFSFYGSIPGLCVVAPYTVSDHKQLLKAAIRSPAPVVFLENEVLYDKTGECGGDRELGKATVLREGTDLTVVGISLALETVERAAAETVHSVEIINLVSLRPIDFETVLKSVEKTRRLVIVEHSWPHFGVASEISAAAYSAGGLAKKVVCLTGADTHVGYSERLERLFYPTKERVLAAISSIMAEE